MLSYKLKLRGAVVGACTAALVVGSGLLAVPAQAGGPTAAAAVRAPQLTRVELKVETFFRHYRDAVEGQRAQTPREVEEEYLTTDLITKLDAYAKANEVDPVFRGQNIPASWDVKAGDSSAGHTTVILTESFDGSPSQDVWYQVRLSDLVIDGLQDPPAASS